MKKLRSFLIYFLLLIVSIIIFLPKESLYFLLEKEMKKYEIIISGEKVSDKPFTLSISDGDLFYKQIESANFKNVSISSFIIYNKISVEDIKISSTFADILPTEIEKIQIIYSIFDPLNIKADSSGDFGVAYATASILDRKVTLHLEPSKILTSRYAKLLNMMKKDETGGYIYEYNF